MSELKLRPPVPRTQPKRRPPQKAAATDLGPHMQRRHVGHPRKISEVHFLSGESRFVLRWLWHGLSRALTPRFDCVVCYTFPLNP
jgi:hypothetical protein